MCTIRTKIRSREAKKKPQWNSLTTQSNILNNVNKVIQQNNVCLDQLSIQKLTLHLILPKRKLGAPYALNGLKCIHKCHP